MSKRDPIYRYIGVSDFSNCHTIEGEISGVRRAGNVLNCKKCGVVLSHLQLLNIEDFALPDICENCTGGLKNENHETN